MKLIANIKLTPSNEQEKLLKETLLRSNEACNWLSKRGFEGKALRQFDLHKLCYKELRSQFGLSAQVAVRCIAKVADSYKLDKKTLRSFNKHSAQPYDDRIFRFCSDDLISIWLLGGRQKIPYVCGEHQRKLLEHRKGEVDLMFVRGNWYLAVVCDFDDPALLMPEGILGVDLGIVNIAADSTGEIFSGKEVEDNRRKFEHRRKNLQKKGTRAAKRKLKKIAGKQSRFQAWVNHNISKAIVEKARTLRFAIAVEDLTGIRDRIKARRRQRSKLVNWGFYQLRQFLEYKAKFAGIPFVSVDPRYTSQTCPSCGHVSKRNRPERGRFLCESCGKAGNADHFAALNIGARATVNWPMLTGCVAQPSFS